MNIEPYPTLIEIVFHLLYIVLFLILDYFFIIFPPSYYSAALNVNVNVHYLIIYLILVVKIYLIPISILIIFYFLIDISSIIILNSIFFHSIPQLNSSI